MACLHSCWATSRFSTMTPDLAPRCLPSVLLGTALALGILVACLVAADSTSAPVPGPKEVAARAELERIVAAEPRNAAACFRLGQLLRERFGPAQLEQAATWLSQAARLEPNNVTYLTEFGGASLELADHVRSFSAATRGRDALEKAVKLDADNLDAREGLFQFYRQAPWPLGSDARAHAQLGEIRRRDPGRAFSVDAQVLIALNEFSAVFRLCDEELGKKPDNYAALFHFGRAAAVCGQNLERGLARLRRCLELPEPGPDYPDHAAVWRNIGDILEKSHQPEAARAARDSARGLQPLQE